MQTSLYLALRNLLGYILAIIISFAHKGLEDFFYDGSKKGIQPRHVRKLADILDWLNAAHQVEDMRYLGG
jgi:proteic killer suppression protein